MPLASTEPARPRPDLAGTTERQADGPAWARWNGDLRRRYTIGVEEEMMLLDPADHALAQCSDAVLGRLSPELARHASPETHAAVLELTTGVHHGVGDAITELARLRDLMADELHELGLLGACAGMYPLEARESIRISESRRYRMLSRSMRSLARRQPTMAMHVHIGIPDAEDAVRVLRRLREAVPILLGLSANSPYAEGRDTGFASTRTMVFRAFPRTGPPRAFAGYDEYVESVDGLIASGALPDPTFLWWDVRLQPGLGTVEVRVMDAQSALPDTAALAALIQALARVELEDPPDGRPTTPEVLGENCFLAARDGIDAQLIDPVRRQLVPLRVEAEALVERCRGHAAALGCADELDGVLRLAGDNGAGRQRGWARAGHGLASLMPALTRAFCPAPSLAFHLTAPPKGVD